MKLNFEIYKPKKLIDLNVYIFLISLVTSFLYILSLYITLNAFFIEKDNFILSVLIYCLVNIGRIIINIPANIIVFHYISFVLLSTYGYNDIKSASFVIFFNFATIVIIFSMGFLSFLIKK